MKISVGRKNNCEIFQNNSKRNKKIISKSSKNLRLKNHAKNVTKSNQRLEQSPSRTRSKSIPKSEQHFETLTKTNINQRKITKKLKKIKKKKNLSYTLLNLILYLKSNNKLKNHTQNMKEKVFQISVRKQTTFLISPK